jgi:hypothetical protein
MSQMYAMLASRGARAQSSSRLAVCKLPNTLLRLVAQMLWRFESAEHSDSDESDFA